MKYKLGEKKELGWITLFQVEAIASFGNAEGDVKVEKYHDPEVKSLKGKKVEVKIDGTTYHATID